MNSLVDKIPVLAHAEPVPDFCIPGIRAWTTTVSCGSFGLGGAEPVGVVMQRWAGLQQELHSVGASRLASGVQVHGSRVSVHGGDWRGWLRQQRVDGHVTTTPGTALTVTVADCTPVFIAHRNGVAVLHAGWRGTASRILDVGLGALDALGCPPEECAIHLGPSICGPCYEVGPEVLEAVTGRPASTKGYLDVRAHLAEQALLRGVPNITISSWCTKCGDGRFFSHRAGDSGRQLGIIMIA